MQNSVCQAAKVYIIYIEKDIIVFMWSYGSKFSKSKYLLKYNPNILRKAGKVSEELAGR